ncbi:L-rhamnose-binding lectin SML-like [Gouania willdenowi]|uniref:L-rhamnose-binding lectin SML-like n=1 Tax=Gouania willdenowi TaxID=441366 RepID=A0A8C5E0G3_GOUWI|nr:L-rhamnose-binding lectin SML-like [Gouania willdenowi]XP_028309276.1 L-rhamnose-binding lectin SML-like [Gouania willdenowi]
MTSSLSSTLLLGAVCLLLVWDSSANTVITCDDKSNVQNMQCDFGVIQVNSAMYGRTNTETCKEGIPIWSRIFFCSLSGTTELLKNRCDGKKTCELSMKDVQLFDPCRRTSKYLETQYTCVPAMTEVVCEDSEMYLSCDEGQVIHVYGADYGRRDKTTCSFRKPNFSIRDVYCSQTADIVPRSCNGKNQCVIKVSNSVFGNPCGRTYKYLEVAYICEYPLSKLDNTLKQST